MVEHYSIPKAKALRDLRILKASLQESERRGIKPDPEELWKFSHVAVLTEGYHGMPTTWNETDPESPAYPIAIQVRIQVEAVIAELEGKRPPQMPKSFPPKDESGQIAEAALHQLFALRRSLVECGKLEVNLSPAELSQYKYVVVRLQMADYDVEVLTWNHKDPQSPDYPLPFRILMWVNAAIKDVLGLPVEAKPQVMGAEPGAKAETPKGKAAEFPELRRELKRKIDVNAPLLSHGRYKEYRLAILGIIFDDRDPESHRIILELLERTNGLAPYFLAVRKAIGLVDQSKGVGTGRRATIDELLQALKDAKHSGRTSNSRFGLALLLLKTLDVQDDPPKG
jgi:hypothetical protein